MGTELTTVQKKDIALLNEQKKQCVELSLKLKNFVITDQYSRDQLFSLSQDTNRLKKYINEVRLNALRPLTKTKKDIKAKYEQKIKDETDPIDKRISNIETYAKDVLIAAIDPALQLANTNIMQFDEAERKRKEAEARRIAEEERKAKEEAERKRKKAEEDAAAEQKKIEDEKARKLAEAQKQNGIAAKLAQKKIEDEAQAEKEKAEKEAALKKQEIEEEERKKSLALSEQQKEISQESKGSFKMVPKITVLDINKVPLKFITRSLNTEAVERAIEDGMVQCEGLQIVMEKVLKYRK